tara:strand:+ start:492 stop:653 length:162 start_codon:yes stop_codon:yes gene_type:complete
MRTLHLTHDEFEVLYDTVENVIQDIESDEVQLSDYKIFNIYQKLQSMGHQSND